MKTVIYHSADYDGIFCREIARKFLGDKDVQYIGWNYGDPQLEFPKEGLVYVLDLSPECFWESPLRIEFIGRLIWIDHHKTAIEKYDEPGWVHVPGGVDSFGVPYKEFWRRGHEITTVAPFSVLFGYRIDGVAACRLAWQWFQHGKDGLRGNNDDLPRKEAFLERGVYEPLAVRLAGEYDIWDKRDPRADTFQYGLRVGDLNESRWSGMLDVGATTTVETLLEMGKWAQIYGQKNDADLVTHKSYRLDWEGLNFLVLNTGRFNSLTFTALDVPETGHDALLGYMFNGKVWTVSLYHAKHRTELDLSVIAKKYGGGGHRGACGFVVDKLPFLPC